MPALIASSAVRTCLGDGEATFAALLAGRSGAAPLPPPLSGAQLGVGHGYPIDDGRADGEPPWRATGLLVASVADALEAARLDLTGRRVAVLVGTGLRELRTLEQATEESAGEEVDAAVDLRTERLHFAAALADLAPELAGAVTISNACSAGGHALALAQDLLELGEADVAVVCATDTMTASMLAMIGRVAEVRADMLRPFDAGRGGVLLGEGAAALVVTGDPPPPGVRPLGRVLATGLSCDAHHETALDLGGVCRAMTDALERSGRPAGDVDLTVAHGTGTVLNDPTEAEAIGKTLGAGGGAPAVTAVKGALGHTSGSAALLSLDVALRCLASGWVPPVVGLRQPIAEAEGLGLVVGEAAELRPELVQVNAFGFGGINAVTLVERAA